MKTKVTTYKSKDKEWIDDAGTSIPYNRITKAERLMERSSARILKEALVINKRLTAFKLMIQELSQEAFDAFMDERTSTKKHKGNFTWYNFDRSIKIEININQPIQFDELGIIAAKEKFEAFLDNNIESKKNFIKKMIKEAFETQRKGNMDVKRVLGLTRYVKEANDPQFTEAVNLINAAIRRPKSKKYFRVWHLDQNNEYQTVELNFSNI